MARPWAGTSSTSPRRSTTPTTCPTSGTRTPRWRPTFIARYRRLRGDEVFHLTGTDEHGLKIQRAAEANGVDAAGVGRRARSRAGARCWARLDIALRRLHPHDRAAPHEAVAASSCNAVHDNGRDDIYLGHVRGPVLRRLRGLLHRGRARSRAALPDPRDARSSCMQRGELLLPAVGVRGPAARALRASTPTACSPRPAATRCSRSIRGGLQDFSISRTTFDWGIPLPWDPEHVVYVWFDALINYITAVGYGDGRRAVRAALAGEHPPRSARTSCGFHAIYWPAMLMAAGLEPPDAGLGARLPDSSAARRCRRRSSPASHPFELIDRLRRRLVPLLLPARDPVRPGRQLLAGSRWSSATTPSSPTASATSRAACSRCSRATSTGWCPSRPSRAPSPTCRR